MRVIIDRTCRGTSLRAASSVGKVQHPFSAGVATANVPPLDCTRSGVDGLIAHAQAAAVATTTSSFRPKFHMADTRTTVSVDPA